MEEYKTKQEAEKWIQSLKPGDKVIEISGWGDNPVAVLTVTKVTKTGIVRTDKEKSFQQSKWSSLFYVGGYGSTGGKIVPYDETLAEEARVHEEKMRVEKENNQIISDAKNIAYKLACGQIKIPLDFAKMMCERFKK